MALEQESKILAFEDHRLVKTVYIAYNTWVAQSDVQKQCAIRRAFCEVSFVLQIKGLDKNKLR